MFEIELVSFLPLFPASSYTHRFVPILLLQPLAESFVFLDSLHPELLNFFQDGG